MKPHVLGLGPLLKPGGHISSAPWGVLWGHPFLWHLSNHPQPKGGISPCFHPFSQCSQVLVLVAWVELVFLEASGSPQVGNALSLHP